MLLCATQAYAHTPESPEVKRLVEKGAEFLRISALQGAPAANNAGGGSGILDMHNRSLGALMLSGMVWYKLTGSESDPVVELAISRTRAAINNNGLNVTGSEGAYETSIAIIFLSEVEKGKYRSDVERALILLIANQQDCGAWMYGAQGKGGAGDTSVTQYAILALWSAKNIGIPIPTPVIAKACNWLVHTQHVSGQFSYLPPMPSGAGRSQQAVQPRSSMTIAGVGSLYICADILRMNLAKNKALESEDGLPTAFRLVRPPSSLEGASFDESLRSVQKEVELGIIDGEKVIAAQFPFADQTYLYYTYYSYERAQSLKDFVTKRKPPAEPEWYNRFVDIARDTQNPDGSWVKGTGRVCDTAFMCLTLMRSMQNVIKKLKNSEGTLVGGRGLPGDTSKAAVRRGRIIGEAANTKEDILKVLDNPDMAALDDLLEQSTGTLLDATPENRSAQLAKLRTTLIDGDFAARRKAIKVLATDERLDNAPLLIFALSDPDMEVVRGAEEGLRRISRRLVSVEIPENASKEERDKRIATWKTWYRNLRPDAIFLK
jgi:hypothetical protein